MKNSFFNDMLAGLTILVLLFGGCFNSSQNLNEERVNRPVSVTNYEPETIFTVHEEPEAIDNLAGLERVILKAQQSTGLVRYVSAFVVPQGRLSIGQEVKVQLVELWHHENMQSQVFFVENSWQTAEQPIDEGNPFE